MNKNLNCSRRDILALNFKDLKNVLTAQQNAKLQVSKDAEHSSPLHQQIIVPWICTSSNHFELSRHKIANKLLKDCRNGFELDDPNMYKTRFFVDYHRLHDPALKRYYKSVPVKNRLKKLHLINSSNDAICSNKDFIEYLRYLDGIRTKKLANTMQLQVCTLLFYNLETHVYDMKFICISRQKIDYRTILKD